MSQDQIEGLPKYMIVPQDGGHGQFADEAAAADKIVHDTARANPGKYVAIYQRVVLVRKHT